MKEKHLIARMWVAIPALLFALYGVASERLNFNAGWSINGSSAITLPRAFNEDEAFRLRIDDLSDTIVWYRKTFRLPPQAKGKKVFIEFEGVRQAADFYLNGHHLGLHENGVMAVGFDLTPYIKAGDNEIALRIDNDWNYREKATQTKYQWNNKNFNANYGGIPKNVWLHLSGKLYQTLPLYSSLGTTGVYIYADNIDPAGRRATINAQSEVKNEADRALQATYEMAVFDKDNTLIGSFRGETQTIAPGTVSVLKAAATLDGLHFWSWGYGYLYTVSTRLLVDGKIVDEVSTRTGFRKTRFAEGKVWLNDRVIQLKGYAQRTSNEWPAVGMSVPAWLSDYSNHLLVGSNGNLVRWMHVTPWKQDVESCDRVGLIQAMPAGDAEKDCQGRQWEQRKELMRDAIVYNRNNPSILFYECGNESVSREHMIEMKAIRDLYDPHGGRAIGSREMLDIDEAEYGGEMLYINKSAKHPMWAMEYSRDEGLRKYWDAYSYPFHKEGAGPLYRNQDASDYNHNQDEMAIENIRRWYDYWRERPGTGRRVSSGGAKIIFSDTNTHFRGEENYRRSGVVDAMRIEKDGYFVHQVMWDGWVDVERPRTHIIGHWNYPAGTVKPVYVASAAERVELLLNGKPVGQAQQSYRFLFTFPDVAFQPGILEAVGYNAQNKEVSRACLTTTGEPATIKLSLIQSPQGFVADGADMALIQAEVVDDNGRRCPLANDLLSFSVNGPAEWRGGIAQGKDNYILSRTLPVECGINRALIRSVDKAGKITITATAPGLKTATLRLESRPTKVTNGISTRIPGNELPCRLDRGETPTTPSYTDSKRDVAIVSATTGVHSEEAAKSFDDNELSEWRNDGRLSTAWITYRLARPALIDDICIKFTGWRLRSYPLDVYAGKELIWSGDTERSLGYIHLPVRAVKSDEITLRLRGQSTVNDAFGQITELAAPQELDLYKVKDGDKTGNELRIIEVEFLETIH